LQPDAPLQPGAARAASARNRTAQRRPQPDPDHGLTLDGFGSGRLFDAAINGGRVAGYIRHVLAPMLHPGRS
jgi:hypothetical protein